MKPSKKKTRVAIDLDALLEKLAKQLAPCDYPKNFYKRETVIKYKRAAA